MAGNAAQSNPAPVNLSKAREVVLDLPRQVASMPQTLWVSRRCGQLANRLVLAANLIAYAEEHGALYFAGLPPIPLRVASVQTAPTFSRGRPEELFTFFEQGFLGSPQILVSPIWDITPDGEQFVMALPDNAGADETAGPRVNVVLNWGQELLERVPVP